MKRRWLTHERQLWLLALAAGAPALALGLALLWTAPYEASTRGSLTAIVVVAWLGIATALRHRAAWPLLTLANLIGGLREGDYSMRIRGARRDDALGELVLEANALAESLRSERLGALEATALLRTVMAEIDVAVFAFDDEGKLRLANRAGERLLDQPAARLIGASAAELGLEELLSGAEVRTFERSFPGGAGRWEARRSSFRQGGLPHQLLVVADLSRPLREEERKAWQRLIRVLGHELNNSLAPIKSIADSLRRRLEAGTADEAAVADLRRGLQIVGERADGLARFLAGYSQLAKLPPPQPVPLAVGPFVRDAAALEARVPVEVEAGPEATVRADRAQLQQLLINLVRNAADAVLESGAQPPPRVAVGWRLAGGELELWVTDGGPGLANPTNLFVPFFTTKPGGTGIGLVLCRQIAEAHGGSLELANREAGPGCVARLRLPRTGQ